MKQVILIRDDIDMSRGKAVAQGSHVSVLACRDIDDSLVEQWLDNGGKKITLAVDSTKELEEIISNASDLPTATIEDRGYTELEHGTMTAGAIGPSEESKIDKYTGNLPLYD